MTANQRPGSYWIQMRGLMDCADAQIQQLAILSYTGSSSQPQSSPPTYRNSLPQGRVNYLINIPKILKNGFQIFKLFLALQSDRWTMWFMDKCCMR